MTQFKDVILSLRNEKGFSQEQMANALNVSKATIGMWEIGQRYPGPEKYEEIADYFNVDMDYLYGRSDVKKKVHYDERGNEYYLNDDTAKAAQEIFEKDRVLFDAYRSTHKDSLIRYAQKLMELERMENGEEE